MEIRPTPFYTKWFEALKDNNAKARIIKRLRRLQNGNPVLVVLLCGGDKGTQRQDIRKAIEIASALE